MKKKIIIESLTAVAILGSVASCGQGSRTSADGITTTFDELPVVAEAVGGPNGDKLAVGSLSKSGNVAVLKATDLIDDLRIVKLDDSDSALVGPGMLWVTDSRFIIYSNEVIKQFDHSGKYIGRIGAKGNGPGEYVIAPYDIYVDKQSGNIYMVEYAAKKIMKYDPYGKYTGDIPLAGELKKGLINVDEKNGVVTVAALQFSGSENAYEVWTQDFEGNFTSSVDMPWLCVAPDFSNEIYSNVGQDATRFNYSLFRMDAGPDSLYRYDGEKLKPTFTMDLGEKKIMHIYLETPRFYYVDLFGEPEMVSENSYVIPSRTPFVVDKATLKGGYANLMLDNIGPIVVTSDWVGGGCKTGDYFAISYDPGTLYDLIGKTIEDNPDLGEAEKAKMEELRESISTDDNNYIVFGRWKK